MTQQLQVAAGKIVQGRNPRTYFDPAEMAELEESVRAKGVLQPLLVRPKGEQYEIVAGERRWRAVMKVHGTDYEIPVLAREMTDEEADEAALVENIQRANMSHTEEAEAAAKVLGRCNGDRDEAARRLGWTRQTLDSRLGLMNCSDSVRKALTERKIKLGHAELLAAVTKEAQDKVLEKLLAQPALPSVAELKSMLNQIARSLDAAIFDKADCAGCQHNSAMQQALFSEAIAAGNCTNGPCYEKKTEETLLSKAESLKDEYPVVRIVRAGENFTLLKLQADGPTGVGEEQAKACRACTNFGAAISAVPDKLGKVYSDLCFDAGCNSKKVAERIKAEKAANEAPKPAPSKQDGKTKTEGKAAQAAKTPAKVQDSQRVKEYRLKAWRIALRNELTANPAKNLVALIALGVCGYGNALNSSKLREVFQKISGKSASVGDVGEMANLLEESGEKAIELMHNGLAATAAATIFEQQVVQYLGWLGADLGRHWKLNEEYLDLLTKSEMEAVAEEIGLKAAVGEKFSKLMGGKKADIIKALLTVEGFDYTGKVPANMRWAKA